MISLVERSLILLSFLLSPCVLGVDIQQELSNLNIQDQGLLKEADFSDSLLEFANGSDQPLNLTSGDKETLRLLGYSNQEIEQLSIGSFVDKDGREKLADRLTTYGNKKSDEINKGVNDPLVPGLASSVIGLSLASLLGITVGVRCSSQPSALAFAGTSAAWVGLEMMIWKGYKINMKDIETLSSIGKIPEMIKKKSNRVKTIIKEIEEDFKESDLADINVFLDSKEAELDELKVIADELYSFLHKAKDKQFGSLRSVQESIALAAETSKKKARNAKIAAMGFTAAAGVAAMEAFNVFGGSGNCFNSGAFNQTQTKTNQLFALVTSLFIKDAQAGFASIGDLDKIGIPLGAGLAAAYLNMESKFADKIYASGTSRSLVFIAMAGLAYYASTKLDEAAKFLDKQASEMKLFVDSVENLVDGKMINFPSGQELINSLKNDLLPSLNEIIEGAAQVDTLKDDLAELGSDLGVNNQEELEELAQEEIKNLKDSEILNELSSFGKSSEDLKSFNADEFSGRVSYEKSFLEIFLDGFTTPAFAVKQSTKLTSRPSCFYRTKTFLKMNESCSCMKSGNCSRTLFPTKLKASSKAKHFLGLYQFAIRADKANNLILQGRPDQGIQLYRSLYSKVAKVDGMTRSALSKKLSKPVTRALSSKMSGVMIRNSKPALVDYLKKKRIRRAPIAKARRSPLLSNEIRKKKRKEKLLRQKVQKNLLMAQALGNPKLEKFDLTASLRDSRDEIEYDYSRESIIKDKNKSIFNIIKKRYMLIMKDGRL